MRRSAPSAVARSFAQWVGRGGGSSHAARSTASSVAPRALKVAATEPSGRRTSNTSGSRCTRYPGGRIGSNRPRFSGLDGRGVRHRILCMRLHAPTTWHICGRPYASSEGRGPSGRETGPRPRAPYETGGRRRIPKGVKPTEPATKGPRRWMLEGTQAQRYGCGGLAVGLEEPGSLGGVLGPCPHRTRSRRPYTGPRCTFGPSSPRRPDPMQSVIPRTPTRRSSGNPPSAHSGEQRASRRAGYRGNYPAVSRPRPISTTP